MKNFNDNATALTIDNFKQLALENNYSNEKACYDSILADLNNKISGSGVVYNADDIIEIEQINYIKINILPTKIIKFLNFEVTEIYTQEVDEVECQFVKTVKYINTSN